MLCKKVDQKQYNIYCISVIYFRCRKIDYSTQHDNTIILHIDKFLDKF